MVRRRAQRAPEPSADDVRALLKRLPPAELEAFWCNVDRNPEVDSFGQLAWLKTQCSLWEKASRRLGDELELKTAIVDELAVRLKLKRLESMVARDNMIVRLRLQPRPDGTILSFGQIRNLIAEYPFWQKMENGRSLTVAAVKAAFTRQRKILAR
jgi:hypothetical protein